MGKPVTNQVFLLLLISIILVANSLLFIPVTLYAGNIESFAVPIGSILVLFCIPALIIIFILFIAGGLMEEKKYNRFILFIAVTGLLVWFQGNILVWDYGLLDGKNIDWEQKVWRGWIDMAIWICAYIFVFAFHRALNKQIIFLSIAIFSIQLLNASYLFYRNFDEFSKKAGAYNYSDNLDKIFSFSGEKNVVHIILDSFQADIFNEIINDVKNGDKYRSELDGFIFYKEHTGAFPTTYLSVPAILGGEIYRNHMPKKEFIRNVLENNSILNAASNAGYEVDLASDSFLIDIYTLGRHTNSYVIPDSYYLTKQMQIMDEALKLFDLSLFRIAPHFLKRYIYNDQRWLLRPYILDTELTAFPYFAHNAFLIDMIQNMSTDRNKPTYKYIHLMSTHWPFVIDGSGGKCRYAGGALPIKREPATWQMRCTLDVIVRLVNKMKETGIYDNTLIVIMGDHGAQITPLRFMPGSKKDESGKYEFNLDAWIMAQATPLMMIKLPQVNGELKVSTAPTSMSDTAITINSVLGFGGNFKGRSMLELHPSEQRERKHYYYHWTRKDWESDYTAPIQEFIVNGSIYEMENWQLGKKYISPE